MRRPGPAASCRDTYRTSRPAGWLEYGALMAAHPHADYSTMSDMPNQLRNASSIAKNLSVAPCRCAQTSFENPAHPARREAAERDRKFSANTTHRPTAIECHRPLENTPTSSCAHNLLPKCRLRAVRFAASKQRTCHGITPCKLTPPLRHRAAQFADPDAHRPPSRPSRRAGVYVVLHPERTLHRVHPIDSGGQRRPTIVRSPGPLARAVPAAPQAATLSAFPLSDSVVG